MLNLIQCLTNACASARGIEIEDNFVRWKEEEEATTCQLLKCNSAIARAICVGKSFIKMIITKKANSDIAF